MKVWLEVVEPRGPARELDPQRDFYVGRKKGNDLVVALPELADNQFIIRFEGDSWRLIDLHGTPWSYIHINDQRMVDRHRLQDGDVVSIKGLVVRFCHEAPVPTQTLDALIADPDNDSLWQVHADELQERGDAFGEYLAHALRGETPDRKPWLDDFFFREEIYRHLTMTWRRGVIESVATRRRSFRDTFELAQFRLLLQSRVGQFLRHLTLDGSEPRLASALAKLADLPRTLESVSVGYVLGADFIPLPPPDELKRRCPRLGDAPVFFTTPGLTLRNEQQTLVLIREGQLHRTDEGALILSEARPPSTLAAFRIKDGSFWFSRGPRDQYMSTRLMLGDELVFETGERFVVGVNDTKDNRYVEPRVVSTGEEREFGGAL